MVTGRTRAWAWLLVTLSGCSGGALEPDAGSPAKPARSAPRHGDESSTEASGKGAATGTGSNAASGTPASSDPTPSSAGGGSAGSEVVATPSAGVEKSYPGHGFVVHEWGTDTIVVGSDGSLQRGLHHEEEDLPAFVYDRIKAANLLAQPSQSVTIKMETPVTYFYSDQPLQVQARVDFPKGVLTQWYPGVSLFLPPVAAANSTGATTPALIADPVLDLAFPFVSDMCREKFSALAGAVLDWGTFDVLPRGTDVTAKLPPAALDDFSWSHARAVSANPVALPGGETERFLFYRGLGDFELPVRVTSTSGGGVSLHNAYDEAIGPVFFINVGAERGAFTAHPQGIAAGGTLADSLPALDDASELDTYVAELSQAVTTSLDESGLYHDEAQAMVNTWKRQWFRTPGARLLYVIPQSWTESSIPLTIVPKPEALLRVMLIRVELITPEQEAADVEAVASFGASSAAQAHFESLGRFAEPRLRRALALSPSAAGEAYLGQIQRAGGSVAGGE